MISIATPSPNMRSGGETGGRKRPLFRARNTPESECHYFGELRERRERRIGYFKRLHDRDPLDVLSACETGLGDVKVGDGVQGLQRAFLLAGARSLVMSLYSVPDTESRELMRDFYGSLKAGKNKAAALHEAELKMIRERRTKSGAAHPFFWASFVLVGEPN